MAVGAMQSDQWRYVGLNGVTKKEGQTPTPEDCPQPLRVIYKENCAVSVAGNEVCEACQISIARINSERARI